MMARVFLLLVIWCGLINGLAHAGLAIEELADGDKKTTSAGDGEPVFETPTNKVALVIGVNNYRHVNSLDNANRDTQLVARALIDLGFQTQILLDPESKGIEDAIAAHTHQLSQSGPSISLVYYAGHGVQIDGQTFMAGVDIRIKSIGAEAEREARRSAVAVETEFDRIVNANASGISMFFFDADRKNPFAESGNRGLARIERDASPLRRNSFIIFSTSLGQVSFDARTDGGRTSPFAIAFADALNTPGLDHPSLFREIRNRVLDLTAGRQVPELRDNMGVEYVLNPVPVPVEPEIDPRSRAATALYRSDSGRLVPTYEDGSYALLIGESDYDQTDDGRQTWRDLPSVTGEVERLADVLENVHGFEVETVIDPDSAELEHALEYFVNRHGVKPNARLFIYMAGHGATTERYGNKVAWFVPSDAPSITPLGPFVNTALNLRRIEEWSEIMEAKHVLWLFDSCFSGAAIKMIETRSGDEEADGWSVHLHTNPVRRVITAGSENEEVPAESRFTQRLTDALSGVAKVGTDSLITGRQIGDFLREDIVRYNFKQGLPKVTPQSDTIVIPREEGDIIFRIEPQLASKWAQANANQ